jgi:hypothetical protein
MKCADLVKDPIYLMVSQTGLDSSTTFNIVRCIRNFVQFREATVLVALLQPAPETYDLFDDIILMAEVIDHMTHCCCIRSPASSEIVGSRRR